MSSQLDKAPVIDAAVSLEPLTRTVDSTSPTHCPFCNGAMGTDALTFGSARVIRCTACGSGTTTPRSVIDHADYVALPTWSEEVERRADDFRRYQRFVLQCAMRFIRAGRLLDVGCSTGLLVDEARKLGFDAHGIDLDPHAIELGRRAGRPVDVCELSEWPHRDYAIVTLSHTLEHVPDLETFLQLCIDRLAPGGYLCVAVPCLRGLLPRLAPRWWYGWMTSQHYWHFSPAGLNALFERVGMAPRWYQLSSMDHRIRIRGGRWQDAVKSIGCSTIACVGGAVQLGDQLVAIAQKQTPADSSDPPP